MSTPLPPAGDPTPPFAPPSGIPAPVLPATDVGAGWGTTPLVAWILLGALAVALVVRLLRAQRVDRGTPREPTAPEAPAARPPAWSDVDYHADHGGPPEAADRQTLVGWCIDVADRLQDREPALAARLRRGLAEIGIETYEPDGEPFDAVRFEAVATEATGVADQDRTVATTRVLGYTDRDVVLRRPEVVVYRLERADDVR